MGESLRQLAGKPGVHLAILVGVTLSALTGGVFVDGFPVAGSIAIIALSLLIALLLREWHHQESSRAAGDQTALARQLQIDVNRTRNALNRVTMETAHPFTEDIVITHRIPRSGQDETTREAVTKVDGTSSLQWRRLRFSQLGLVASPGSAPGFEILHAACNNRDMEHVEVASSGNTHEIAFFLDDVLRGGTANEVASWEVRYSRVGTWDPLRSTGEDQFNFRNPYRSGRTVVRLVFTDWNQPPTDFLRREPMVGTVRAYAGMGGHVLEWEVDDPEPDKLHTAWIRAK